MQKTHSVLFKNFLDTHKLHDKNHLPFEGQNGAAVDVERSLTTWIS